MVGMSWIISSVPAFCRSSPLTQVFSFKAFGSLIASGDANIGPIGPNLSNDLA
jgi:hypothetical protein